MAQNYSINPYDPNNGGLSDLQYMENNFECLRTLFSGNASPFPLPSQMFAGQPWYNTTNKVFQIRNSANDDWLGVMIAPATQKIWVYRDSAMDGWLIDSVSATDCIIALKGGSQAYNTTGGDVVSTWTLPTQNLSHSHKWINHSYSAHDTTYLSDGITTINVGINNVAGLGIISINQIATDSAPTAYTSKDNLVVDYGSAWRPKAAVGTLQYLNI